eukprot:321467-Amphidinium_carterae.1
MAGFDANMPQRAFFTRLLVCVNVLVDLLGFVTVPASSKQLAVECAKGRLPRAWTTAVARMGAQLRSKRLVRAPLVSEFAGVVTVSAQSDWQLRGEVTLDNGSGRVLELR